MADASPDLISPAELEAGTAFASSSKTGGDPRKGKAPVRSSSCPRLSLEHLDLDLASTSAASASFVSAKPASSASSSPSSSSRPAPPSSASSHQARTPAEHNAANAFLLLPNEILALVVHFADWPSARALRQTSSYLRATFGVLTTIRKVEEHRRVLMVSDRGQWPAPCYRCLRMLPRASFHSNITTYTALNGYGSRACTDCLVACKGMPRGASYHFGGVEWTYCLRCEKHRRRASRLRGRPNSFADHCGRCRDMRIVGEWIVDQAQDYQNWLVLLTCVQIVLAAMIWRTVVRLWRGTAPYDHPVLSWAFFTACHTLVIPFGYWILVACVVYTPNNRFHRMCDNLLDSDLSVFEAGIEWIMILIAACMPFATHNFATVPLLGWAMLAWICSNVNTLLRCVNRNR